MIQECQFFYHVGGNVDLAPFHLICKETEEKDS